jgi:ribosomal-protein-alanine N-acetyltransferase
MTAPVVHSNSPTRSCRRFWGNGYAFEEVRASLSWARATFESAELLTITQSANERSCRLLDRLGAEAIAEFVEFGALQLSYRLP